MGYSSEGRSPRSKPRALSRLQSSLWRSTSFCPPIVVVGMALRYRAMAAFAKGATMALFGLWVTGVTAWHVWHGTVPQAFTMTAVGTRRAPRQCDLVRAALGVPPGRLQHALGVDLEA